MTRRVFAAAALAFGSVAMARLALAGRGVAEFIDDGFYYLLIARNFAESGAITFDGVNPTNGFHPLWMADLHARRDARIDRTTHFQVMALAKPGERFAGTDIGVLGCAAGALVAPRRAHVSLAHCPGSRGGSLRTRSASAPRRKCSARTSGGTARRTRPSYLQAGAALPRVTQAARAGAMPRCTTRSVASTAEAAYGSRPRSSP